MVATNTEEKAKLAKEFELYLKDVDIDHETIDTLYLQKVIHSVRLYRLGSKNLRKILITLNKENGSSRYNTIIKEKRACYKDYKEILKDEIRKVVCKEITESCNLPKCWSVGELSTSNLFIAFLKAQKILRLEIEGGKLSTASQDIPIDYYTIFENIVESKSSTQSKEEKILEIWNKCGSSSQLNAGNKIIIELEKIKPVKLNAKQLNQLTSYTQENYQSEKLPPPLRTTPPLPSAKNKKEFCSIFISSIYKSYFSIQERLRKGFTVSTRKDSWWIIFISNFFFNIVSVSE